jgi:hypothetical protein
MDAAQELGHVQIGTGEVGDGEQRPLQVFRAGELAVGILQFRQLQHQAQLATGQGEVAGERGGDLRRRRARLQPDVQGRVEVDAERHHQAVVEHLPGAPARRGQVAPHHAGGQACRMHARALLGQPGHRLLRARADQAREPGHARGRVRWQLTGLGGLAHRTLSMGAARLLEGL